MGHTDRRGVAANDPPSPGTPGEGRGEGSSLLGTQHSVLSTPNDPHPNPLPEYRERGQGPALLRAQNVHRILGAGDAAAHILKGVSLSIARDEYVSIVGQSGSGKSTLLYLLGGLDRPTRVNGGGEAYDPPSAVFIDGQDTSRLNDTDLAALRNEKVGFVFQFHYLLKEFTAQENVALPMLKLKRLGRSASMDRAAALLKQLGLADKVRRPANRLSGGEQQRVAIARALANEPAVLLADEPTGNLDRRNSELVADIFKDLSGRGGQSIVMVTHDLALAHRARRIIRMDDGEVIDDRPNEPTTATDLAANAGTDAGSR